MITVEAYRDIIKDEEDRLPLLTLKEFFEDNPFEYAIAPNDVGYGRPDLEEIWEYMKKVEKMPHIAWVRVALHDDTEIVEQDDEEKLLLYGDTIVICSDLNCEELEELIDYRWLCSGGIETTTDWIEEYHFNIPEIPDGYDVHEMEWD